MYTPSINANANAMKNNDRPTASNGGPSSFSLLGSNDAFEELLLLPFGSSPADESTATDCPSPFLSVVVGSDEPDGTVPAFETELFELLSVSVPELSVLPSPCCVSFPSVEPS